MSHFPSNTDPHLRSQQQEMFQYSQVSDSNPNLYQPNLHMVYSNHQPQNSFGVNTTIDTRSTIASSGNYYNSNNVNVAGSSFLNPQQQQILNQTKSVGVQMGYQDAWRVCHPDYKNPFTSLEDACERLLPYHVVADYEEEEDDKIIDSGEMMSRSQQWDNIILDKVAEFTTKFEKQVDEFNLISNKQKHGELQTEERLMIEHMLLQDEKRAMLETNAAMESRQRAALMAAMAHSRSDFLAHPEMLFGGAALESQTSSIPIIQNTNQHDQVAAMTSCGWGNIGHFPVHPEMLFGGASLGSQTNNTPNVQNMNQQDQVSAMTSSGWGNIGHFPAHQEMLFGGAALGSQTTNIPIVQNRNQHDQVAGMTSSGWGNMGQRDENGKAVVWRDGGDLDLNAM